MSHDFNSNLTKTSRHIQKIDGGVSHQGFNWFVSRERLARCQVAAGQPLVTLLLANELGEQIMLTLLLNCQLSCHREINTSFNARLGGGVFHFCFVLFFIFPKILYTIYRLTFQRSSSSLQMDKDFLYQTVLKNEFIKK